MNTIVKYSFAAMIAAIPVITQAQAQQNDSSSRTTNTQRTEQTDRQQQNNRTNTDRSTDNQRTRQNDSQQQNRTQDQTRARGDRSDMNHKAGVRVSKYIGKAVYNHENEKIGGIEDLVMDGGYNRISYAVLSFGGFLGMGDKYFAIPWSSLEHRQGQDDRLYLNISEQRLKDAPGFDKDAWPNTADASFRTQVDKHYGVNRDARTGDDANRRTTTGQDRNATAQDRNTAAQDRNTATNNQDRSAANRSQRAAGSSDTDRQRTNSNNSSDANRRSSSPGDSANRSASGPTKDGLLWARRVSEVIDADIKNASDQDVGEIEDLIVEPASGRIIYAVIDLERDMRAAERYAAIPMNKLTTDATDEEFILRMGRDDLRNAPSFKNGQWPDWSDNQFRNRVDRLSDAQ